MLAASASLIKRGLLILPRAAVSSEVMLTRRFFQSSLMRQPIFAEVRHGRRQLHVSTATNGLVDAIKEEIEHERKEAPDPDNSLTSPIVGWDLHAVPDSTEMKLSKDHDGQKVEVVVNTVEQEDAFPPEEDDEEPEWTISFTVNCVKGKDNLRFTCAFVENDTQPPIIQHVAILPKDGFPDPKVEDITYEGPTFSELDENLQDAFAEHLLTLGVDANLGQYLCRLVYDKEQTEYVQWLHRVQKWAEA